MSKPARRSAELELRELLQRLLNLLDSGETKNASVESEIPKYPCVLLSLPREKWISSAQRAAQINRMNLPAAHQLDMTEFAMADVVAPEAIALMTSRYWGNTGVKLTVGFLEPIDVELRNRILSHMNAWTKYGNIEFTYSTTDPQVRITRESGGYKSYLGTDILSIDPNEPTMWLQGFSMETPDSEFYRVVRHETGHTLGFTHEHMRKEIVDLIDREQAIVLFMRTQGWTREEVIAQVLTPLSQSAITATVQADPNSIMCYALPASIMKNGQAVPGGKDIDAEDGQFASTIYPKTGSSSNSVSAKRFF